MQKAWLVGALACVQFSPTVAYGQDRTWEWQQGMHPMMFMWGAGGLVVMIMMLVFWGLIIAGLVLGVRWLASQGAGPVATKRWRSCANATREARLTSRSSRRASVISYSEARDPSRIARGRAMRTGSRAL